VDYEKYSSSGLMLAAHAAKRGRSVLILEKANKIGKKILMSGGGKYIQVGKVTLTTA
jgi:predicted flavoprotein YhiN